MPLLNRFRNTTFRNTTWAFALALLALPVLGWVQYRWIDRVSEAELQREAERVRQGLVRVAEQVDAEVTRAQLYFAVSPMDFEGEPLASGSARVLGERLKRWAEAAPYPAIVAEIRLWAGSGWSAVDPKTGALREVADLPGLTEQIRPGAGFPPVLLGDGRVALRLPAGRLDGRRGPAPGLQGGRGMGGGRRGPGRGGPPFRGRPPFGGEGPPPDRPFRPDGPPPPRRDNEDDDPRGPGPGPRPVPTLIRAVILDTRWMASTMIPALVERNLGPGAWDVEAVRAEPTTTEQGRKPDAEIRLLSIRPECLGADQSDGPEDVLRSPARPCQAVPPDDETALWKVGLRHRSGSLAGSIETFRQRNMAISFGVLAALAAAICALWLSMRRAASLARQQMEFAMSISHELRTPLTVMRLAGDNLAQGVATNPDQVKRYGETIRREAERLSAMVEHVLTFARAQRPEFVLRPEPVAPGMIVDGALSATGTLLKEAGFTVVREAEPDLPMVHADANLLITAVTNLVMNAVRHADSGKWVRIRATAGVVAGRVEFEVADQGPGIPKRELGRVFRPFYRGAGSGSTRGTGLGLHLVKRIAEAHGGTVAIESNPGAGTVVTLSIPVAPVVEEPPA